MPELFNLQECLSPAGYPAIYIFGIGFVDADPAYAREQMKDKAKGKNWY